jgi:hypothetical protein
LPTLFGGGKTVVSGSSAIASVIPKVITPIPGSNPVIGTLGPTLK